LLAFSEEAMLTLILKTFAGIELSVRLTELSVSPAVPFLGRIVAPSK
jgi:hypothetical protein